MSVPRTVLLAVAALVALSPLAGAGSLNDPEVEDASDDVELAGASCSLPSGCVFQPDFIWANADIQYVWVNDTADALLLTVSMRAGTALSPDAGLAGSASEADPFTYTDTVGFTVAGTAYEAVAIMGADGVFTVGGIASEFLVHDMNKLTLTVPKGAVGDPANGVIVGGLYASAHGQDDNGMTVDDRAPDADGGRDYAIANTTAPAAPPAANNTGTASPGEPGPAVTGSSTGPTRPPVSGTASTTSRSTSTNSTSDDDGKDTPGLPAMLGAVTLLAVVAFIRRRL
jgi:hypothetical protein